MLKKIILLFFILFLSLPAVFADGDSNIVPVLWLFCRKGKIQSLNWCNALKNTSCIYQYNSNRPAGSPVKVFKLSNDNNIYQYNSNRPAGSPVKVFKLSNDNNIYQYNSNRPAGSPAKVFKL